MKKIAIIPARSGSKGLPNKNILMLLDKHLLGYTIEAAIKSNQFDQVIVSTDSKEYGMISELYGANVIYRSAELASDTASTYEVLNDVLKSNTFDYFVLLQPTSPFRNEHHIVEAINKFEDHYSSFDFLVSMCQSDKSSLLIKPLIYDSLAAFDLDYSNYRRQDGAEYSPNGAIFIGKSEEYKKQKHFFGKRSLAYIMDKESSVDIDTKIDFELAITIANRKNKEKNLYKAIIHRIAEKSNNFSSKAKITLIGHSIFDYWDINEIMGFSVNNLGIAGINTSQYNELIFQNNLIKSIGDIIVIIGGTNDIVLDDWKKENTKNNINDTILYLRKLNSKSRIIYVDVPNVNNRFDHSNKVINELNLYLKQELSNIEFVSLKEMNDFFGNLNYRYTNDGLHFNEVGYEKLKNILEEALRNV